MTGVAAIILAAGASTRLGEPKQLITMGGERLLERAARTAREAGCDPIVIVLGASASLIQSQCSLGDATVVINAFWPEGMASSIRSGVGAVVPVALGAIVMTCDQPAVSSRHLQRLIEADPHRVTASSYAGRRGVPAYFPADHFAELLQLRGDAGARPLLSTAESVKLEHGELDVDTPAALAAARELYDEA